MARSTARSSAPGVEPFLVPELRPGDIVILDNLSSHKVEGVRTAIENAKACLLYLPSYSKPSPQTNAKTIPQTQDIDANNENALRVKDRLRVLDVVEVVHSA